MSTAGALKNGTAGGQLTNPQCAGIEYCSVRTDCEAGAVVDIIPQHLAAKTSNEGVNLENRIPARQVRFY